MIPNLCWKQLSDTQHQGQVARPLVNLATTEGSRLLF